jgi:hypothetical protein
MKQFLRDLYSPVTPRGAFYTFVMLVVFGAWIVWESDGNEALTVVVLGLLLSGWALRIAVLNREASAASEERRQQHEQSVVELLERIDGRLAELASKEKGPAPKS